MLRCACYYIPMPDKLTTDERLDKVDAQLIDMNERMDERFSRIDERFEEMSKQLDKIATVVVKGFDRIDKALELKANKADVDRIF